MTDILGVTSEHRVENDRKHAGAEKLVVGDRAVVGDRPRGYATTATATVTSGVATATLP